MNIRPEGVADIGYHAEGNQQRGDVNEKQDGILPGFF